VVFAQSNNVYVTVSPTQNPDTITKPAVVIDTPQGKSTSATTAEVHQSAAVSPESRLSIGKASAVTKQGNNSVAPATAEQNINHSEQKVEKQETPPANNPAVVPK
jgi:hypothetical protein